jgi:large subunit ribosomal protein L17
MPATPRKSRRFGGSASHQRLMMANLVASLIAAEGIDTTEAKAKALRPVAEKMITKAKKGGVHNQRQVVAFIGDKDMASSCSRRSGRLRDRPGGYTRILKLGRATATTRRWLASNWSERRTGPRPPACPTVSTDDVATVRSA